MAIPTDIFLEELSNGKHINKKRYDEMVKVIHPREFAFALERRFLVNRKPRTIIESLQAFMQAEDWTNALRLCDTYPVLSKRLEDVLEARQNDWNQRFDLRPTNASENQSEEKPEDIMTKIMRATWHKAYFEGDWDVIDKLNDMTGQ